MENLSLSMNPNLPNAVDDPDTAFLHKLFDGDLAEYEQRLQALGFVDLPTVLDAGSGYGQWALPLARYNRIVWGVEPDEARVRAATALARLKDVRNVCFLAGSLESLDFPDGHFDGIFCTNTLHRTEEAKTLDEFKRLLKPGGLLYINFNTLGWFLHLFGRHGILRRNKNALHHATTALKNFAQGHKAGPHPVSVGGLRRQLCQRGFQLLALGADGQIRTVDCSQPQPDPGSPGVWEVLARK